MSRKLQSIKLEPSRYPTANGNQIKTLLAKQFNCQTNNIFIANGSENIILNIPKIFTRNTEVIIPQLTFPLFQLYSQLAGLKVRLIPMKKDLGIDLRSCQKAMQNTSEQLIFVCNPNNPTGMILSRRAIISFLDKIPETTTVVIDEANIDFGGETVIDQALIRKNVVVIRTFSKGFGLAGMRIGFAIGNEQFIEKLINQTQPFPISSLSEELAMIAVTDPKFVSKSKQYMKTEREKIKQKLTMLGCTVFNSQANNIFAKLPANIVPDSFFKKLKAEGVSVVKGSKFARFDDSFFRVSPKSEETNNVFLQIMEKVLIS